MFSINGLETESLGHLLYLDHLLRKKERIICFAEFIIMSSTLLRIVGPSIGFLKRSLGKGPWSSLNGNLRCKGTLYPIKKRRE